LTVGESPRALIKSIVSITPRPFFINVYISPLYDICPAGLFQPDIFNRRDYSMSLLRKNLCYGSVLILGALLLFAGCSNPAGSNGTSYTVKFDSQGGGDVPSQSVASGGKATAPRAVVKDGNKLDGWYESLAGGDAWDFAVDTVTGDLTLHAKWSAVAANAWVVSFDAGGGSPAPADQEVANNALASAPSPVPSKEGYILDGWHRNPEFTGSPWNFSSSPVTASVVLYAKWTPVEAGKAVVVFDARGGAPVPAQRAVDKGSILTMPPNPAREGYDFDGWHASLESGAAWDFAVDTAAENITLYAKWTVKQYAVTFDSRGGDPVAGQNVAHGEKIAEPGAPANGDLFLEGWYKESGLTTKWSFAVDTVTGPVTLFAKWVAVPPGHFLVRFDSRGGGDVASQFVAENGKAAKPDDPARNNFVFDAWYKDAAYAAVWNFDADTVAAATTLYAAWTPVWTVTFNTQPGSDIAPLTGVVNGETVAKPAADPTRDGYRFGGWYKEAAGTNVWNFATDTITANTVIYAKWIPLYTVTFDTAGGSVVAPAAGVLSGTVVAKPAADPTLENCVFDAWYKEADYTNKWDFAADTVAGNITLYARWTVRVSFVANGGAPAPEVQTPARGSLVVEPDLPLKSGQTFMGWFKEAACANEWNFASDTVAAHTSLYAKWDFVPATGISGLPADGLVNQELDLNGVTVEPANASVKTIVWTVREAGAGLNAGAAAPIKPTAVGALKLKAVIPGGGAGGADFVKDDFAAIPVALIRQVAAITGIALSGTYEAGTTIDLKTAKVSPPNATATKIDWAVSVPDAGVGVNDLVNNAFTLTGPGTLKLTATIVNGAETIPGVLSNFVQEFSFFVKPSISGEVGWNDGTLKLYVNDAADPLPADAVIAVSKGESYYIGISSRAYDTIEWRLNGNLSSIKGPRLKLDTETPGTVVVRVEVKKNNEVDDGVYTFIISD
jgi:uncharacterized repeat protein (TIGR02543 family)